ncbi:MAG: hypothetical protein NTX49_01085 [Chlamydiae bacterium]|nr:hypothetical protein [Chlamydiota bacterium]
MASPASSTSPIGYHLLPPDSKESNSGFSFTSVTVNASRTDLSQLDRTQTARICGVSKNALCNICTVSTAGIMILSGAILAITYNQEIPGIVLTAMGFALCYFPVCRLIVTDC